MSFIANLRKNLKYIKPRDVVSLLIFVPTYLCALPLRIWFKLRSKRVWLITESPDTARDNGYHFFKYITQTHPEISAYYAIEKNSTDRSKVTSLGRVINYGSFKHWIYYLAAAQNIGTQKSGNPAPPLFYLLHIYGFIRNNRIFLQHGITYNNQKWLYYNETKFRLIVCGAKKEYEYVLDKFNYPEGSVAYTGFARFDNLYDYKKNPKQILVMPTWRSWLGRETNILGGNKTDFINTPYFRHWSSLLNNEKLLRHIETNGITLYFYPHFNMQKYTTLFESKSNNIKVVSRKDVDIQTLLKESSLLITDYSSIFFDFAYMKKPLLYYQFDEEEFRKRQYEEGYFSYRKDGFGSVVKNEERLVDAINDCIDKNFTTPPLYSKRADKFFALRDKNNSERIYQAILALRQGRG